MRALFDSFRRALEAESAQGRMHGWRLALTRTRKVSIGINDNVAGGAYAPPILDEHLALSYLVAWDEEQVSRGQIASVGELDFPALLDAARKQAHADADAIVFPGAATIPKLRVHLQEVAALVEKDPSALAEMLVLAKDVAKSAESEVLSGSCQARERESIVESSGGFRGESRGTLSAYGFYFDGRYGDGKTSRGVWTADEARTRLLEAATTSKRLGGDPVRVTPGSAPVLFHPAVAQGLITSFLLGNLGGNKVVHGMSAFPLESFDSGRQVLREGFTVGVDPLRDDAVGSYSFSSEGVVSSPVLFIENGRLVTPYLNLKLARRTGREPTASPRAGDTLVLEDPLAITPDEAFARLGEGLLVFSLLGLHTQDPSSGCFSLVAAQALLHRDAIPVGPCPAVVAGRLLEAFSSGEGCLVNWPGEDWPGLLMTCDVMSRS